MKINYIFRSKLVKKFSIENVFNNVIREVAKKLDTSSTFVPYPGTNPFKVFRNILFAKNTKGDINHITGDVHYVALLLNPRTTILTIHDLVTLKDQKGIKKFLLRLMWFDLPIRRSKLVTVISKQIEKELISVIPHAKSKTRVIYDPVSSDFAFEDKYFNESCPTILQIGTAKNKNLENVTKAIAGINCRVEIIGRLTAEQENLLKMNNITYSNSYDLTNDGVRKKYVDSDIVIFASTYEGFGLPIVEAQATGRVVITSNIAPMNEVAGEGACFVDPYDIGSIKNAILKVCGDSKYRNNLIELGKKNVKRFSEHAIASEYIKLYEEISKCEITDI